MHAEISVSTGGHDLSTVGGEHLVAVVGRRVVRSGDHDPGGGAELRDVPREHRRRHHVGEDHRPHAPGGADPCRVEGEGIALAPGVVADDHAPLGRIGLRLQQVVDETGRGLLHDQTVHPLWAGTDGGAQPGGAELQPPVEPGGQLVVRTGEQSLELVTHVGVGFGGQPAARHAAEIAHGKSVRNSTNGRGPTWEITSAAAIAPIWAHSASERRRV